MLGELPQPTPNSTIKAFVEGDGIREWKHGDRLKWLYRMHDVVTTTWFGQKDDSQLALPQAVMAIEKMDVRTLAAFNLTYNPNGLPNEIIMNEQWIQRPDWELMESLTHETIHLFQEYNAREKKPGFYSCANTGHNKQFVEIAEEIGLHPFPGAGFHWKQADGQFERLMTEYLYIQKPDAPATPGKNGDAPTGYWWDGSRGKAKGSSSLLLYTSDDCTDPNPCKVRSGRKDLDISCGKCGGKFAPHSH